MVFFGLMEGTKAWGMEYSKEKKNAI